MAGPSPPLRRRSNDRTPSSPSRWPRGNGAPSSETVKWYFGIDKGLWKRSSFWDSVKFISPFFDPQKIFFSAGFVVADEWAWSIETPPPFLWGGGSVEPFLIENRPCLVIKLHFASFVPKVPDSVCSFCWIVQMASTQVHSGAPVDDAHRSA